MPINKILQNFNIILIYFFIKIFNKIRKKYIIIYNGIIIKIDTLILIYYIIFLSFFFAIF